MSKRGFGSPRFQTPEGKALQRTIASKGGKAAHQKGTAHEWTFSEAQTAGRKGGLTKRRVRLHQPSTKLDPQVVEILSELEED